MQAKLIVTGGKANRKEVSLAVPLVVGRSRGAGLTIAHPMVSRQHCQIYEADGLLRIRDLGSTNGTYVSGRKIDEAVLRPHDQFTIGPLTFEVDYQYAGDATSVEPKYEGLAAEAILSPEAPELVDEGAEPPEALAEALVEPAEAVAAAESASESLEFTEAPAEFVETPSPDQSRDEDFQFAESGEQFPLPNIAPADGQVPDFSAWSNVPTGAPAVPSDVESIAPQGYESPEESALESEPNPWEDSSGESGETETTALFPPAPSPKPKAKKGWWPFS